MSTSTLAVPRQHLSRQRGMSLIAFVVLIGVIAFFATILLKVGPTYQNFWSVRTIMNEVANPNRKPTGGARGVALAIQSRLDINSLSFPTLEQIDIKKAGSGKFLVTLDYEHRVHLFYNVDAVTSFTYQVEVDTL